MTLKIPQHTLLQQIHRSLPRSGIFLVGGTVRDLLLRRPVLDVDIVVTGIPIAALKKKLSRFGSIAMLGEKFGTLRLTPPRSSFHIDVALPRTERGKGTGGYKDFSFRPDHRLPLQEDLSRRDFTVNAMAIRLSDNEIIDLFGGVKDLRQKLLRTVGKPVNRFREDYSRLLRLLRFSVTLGFSVDRQTAVAARRLMPRLNAKRDGHFIVPREVIAEQLIRTFTANPVLAFDAYDHFGAFRVLLPEVARLRRCRQTPRFHSEGDVFAHTRLALTALASPAFRRTFRREHPMAVSVIAALLHDVGKPAMRRIIHEHEGRRVHFWGHEIRGAAMARRIGDRLKIASYEGCVRSEDLAWLIRRHLIVTTNNPQSVRASTLAEYFGHRLGASLCELIWADQSASYRRSGRPAIQRFLLARKRLRSLFRSSAGTVVLPKPLLTGNDLMKVFGLSEGPAIGALLAALREEQLEGRVRNRTQAHTFLRSRLQHTNG